MEKIGVARVVLFAAILGFLYLWSTGCATTSQIKALEEKTQQALNKAEEALKESQKARAAVQDSSEYRDEAASSAQKAETAADRAENYMLRSSDAARAAEISAHSAQEAARKCQDILDRLTAK